MATLRISRVMGENHQREIAQLKLCDSEWDRLRCSVTPQSSCACLLDLLDDSGRDTLYEPICISAAQSEHLLRYVFMLRG
jgi:hypothetical protein